MRMTLPIVSILIAGTLASCSEKPSAEPPPAPGSSASSAVAAAPATSTSKPPAPAYQVLTPASLEKALVQIDQLPPGYSQDPPSDDGGNKYFCDYKPPAEEMIRVRRDFTKGGGLSAELLSITIRQFKSEEEARAAWTAMTKTLKTRKTEVYEGTRLTYSLMSAPKLGDASTGLKMDADGTTLLQNFVLVGPAMISVGGGGLMNADADTMAKLLKTQVERYGDAAMR